LSHSVDVNVLLHASFTGSPLHEQSRDLVELLAREGDQLLIPSPVASGFLRLATDRRAFTPPKQPREAVAFLDALLATPTVSLVEPGRRHWPIFRSLIDEHALRGPDVSDAYLAAIAIERGATWVSYDRGFARFRGLRWLDPASPA